MPRPKSDDPKVNVTLTIKRSTRDTIKAKLPKGRSVPAELSAAVERKYGEQPPAAGMTGVVQPERSSAVAPRFKGGAKK